VDAREVTYETLDGETHTLGFDFAMLLPPFTGVGLRAVDRTGEDITAKVFAPNAFMRVDADYTPKPYEEWGPADWPKTYQSPHYPKARSSRRPRRARECRPGSWGERSRSASWR
jgi:sulfide:quinone oxidoreductase